MELEAAHQRHQRVEMEMAMEKKMEMEMEKAMLVPKQG